MEFGRFSFVRSRSFFTFAVLLITASAAGAGAQQVTPSSPAQKATQTSPQSTPEMPMAMPISEAAIGTTKREAPKATDQNSSIPKSAAPGSEDSSQRLGAGDLIEVAVYNVPELSTKARIGNAGDVYLPLIDYVHVGDLTVEEAQTLIAKRLEDGGFVRSAHVTIFVDESASQGITILGEVAKPGIYPSVGNRKLYDLISAAGGFSPAAGRRVSVIRQHDPTAPITLSLARNLADDPQDNIDILPGDTIAVPRAPIIYVVGDVGRPAGLLVDNGTLTVLQALALAGGPNHTAKMGSVRIIRKGPNGMMETPVPLKKMLEAKSPDITLQADDILFVPLSGMRVAAQQATQAAISAAVGIAVISAHP
jgi:polysaccharide biosynthesis/export protein